MDLQLGIEIILMVALKVNLKARSKVTYIYKKKKPNIYESDLVS